MKYLLAALFAAFSFAAYGQSEGEQRSSFPVDCKQAGASDRDCLYY